MAKPVHEVHIPFSFTTIFILLSWLFLNIVITFYNKWLYTGGLPFPLIITTTHSLVGLLLGCSAFFMENSAVKSAWKPLLILSFLFCASIATNNISLLYINVSTSQLIKALTPVFQVGISFVVERRTYPVSTLSLIPVICVGSFLALYKPIDWHPFGYALAFLSAFSTALQSSVSAILMTDLKVDVYSTWLWNSIGSFCLLMPCIFVFETSEFEVTWQATDHWSIIWRLSLGMMIAMAYNICNYSFIRATSSVYTSIVGLVKAVLVIIISLYVSPIELEYYHIIGIVTVIFGFGAFSYTMAKNKKSMNSQKKEDIEDDYASTQSLIPSSSSQNPEIQAQKYSKYAS